MDWTRLGMCLEVAWKDTHLQASFYECLFSKNMSQYVTILQKQFLHVVWSDVVCVCVYAIDSHLLAVIY